MLVSSREKKIRSYIRVRIKGATYRLPALSVAVVYFVYNTPAQAHPQQPPVCYNLKATILAGSVSVRIEGCAFAARCVY